MDQERHMGVSGTLVRGGIAFPCVGVAEISVISPLFNFHALLTEVDSCVVRLVYLVV